MRPAQGQGHVASTKTAFELEGLLTLCMLRNQSVSNPQSPNPARRTARSPHAPAMLRRLLKVGPRRLLDATQLTTSSGGRCQLAQPCSAELERQGRARGAPPEARSQAPSAQQRQQQVEARMERKPLAPPGYSRTFYKRQLPSPPAIEFASERGELRFVMLSRRAPCRRLAKSQHTTTIKGWAQAQRRCHRTAASFPCPPSLPEPCLLASAAGRQVFAEALAAGTMNNFFKLIEQFRTQVGLKQGRRGGRLVTGCAGGINGMEPRWPDRVAGWKLPALDNAALNSERGPSQRARPCARSAPQSEQTSPWSPPCRRRTSRRTAGWPPWP